MGHRKCNISKALGGQNMSGIEKKISDWRRQMKRKRRFRHTDLDELEAHLRDVIDDLTASGSSPDEAFATAVRQLGDAHSLSDEFY